MSPRLVDVARHAGVSQATASRVLNGKLGVSEETRNAVLSAADALGYQTAGAARRRVSSLLGVIVPELENPVFAAFAQHLTTLLAQGGSTPMLCTQTAGGIGEDEWVEMLLEREVAGLIVVSGMHADTHSSLDRYRRLLGLRVALVLVNGYADGVEAACISTDDAGAMSLAVDHLRALGHESIGLAVGPDRYTPVIRKVAGFTSALVAAGDGAEPLVEHSLFTIEGGHAAAQRLLVRGATAIVCASDLMALGAVRACRARGLSVPEDVSVVGYDDSALVASAGPPLTTVRQPVPAMCRAAVRVLLDELGGAPAPRHEYVFQPELVVRGSTGPVSRRR